LVLRRRLGNSRPI